MVIKCDSQKLSRAVNNVQRAVSEKSTLAALEGILIRAENNNLYLCGYDLEFGISTNLETQVKEEGEIVLNAKLLGEILRKIPGQQVEIKTDERKITSIKSDNSNFSIVGISAGEYPELPDISDSTKISLPGNLIKDMIKQTIFAVADNDSNPVHTGVLFEVSDEEIKMIAVDGYRLALRKEKIKISTQKEEKIRFVVPGKTLNEVFKLINEETNTEIFVGDKHVVLNIDGYKVISRLLEGRFLDYKAAVPKSCETTVMVNTRDIINSVERVSLIITDRLKSPLNCVFGKEGIRLSCTTAIGRANDEIYYPCEGQEVEIGFNNKYLLDALKNSETDEVKLELSGALSPMKVVPKSGDKFLFLVLPVRIKR